ncbi:type VI secretion system tip protein VgrG [Acidobacteria bacterium AB60]|nr:type VI secretion system tip protein VgrG [Acidobacteria bacterium AB60]
MVMPLYTQKGRLISLTTPLGEDKLLLTTLAGHEAISRLFQFHLNTLSEDTAIAVPDILGQTVTINITQSDDSQRYFNGIVSHFVCAGKEGDMTRYELHVVPKLWLLTRYSDCRIFHNMSAPDIIKRVLDQRGIAYQASLQGDYRTLEYCVQYRETDFNFISRLMEQNGIFYFFEHSESEHKMKLGDSNTVHLPCPVFSNAGYNLATGGLDAGDVVNSWSLGNELRSGKVSLTDYDFIHSTSDLAAAETTIHTVAGNGEMELFDYPGLHLTTSEGKAITKIRMQEEEAVYAFARGGGVCRAFTSGYKFDLQEHPLDAMNASYLLTEVRHMASSAGTYRDEAGAPDTYSNDFTCIPADVPFRPQRITPKPLVQGLQSAIVVGKNADQDSANDQDAGGDGEEIWVDKWGRVLVRFPWDRASAVSCWVRVSQDWAGQGWGMINIPRVGQEVLVSFLDGDPDRPVITGRVYNDVQTVPYKLPDNGTRTTFRTSSSTGGGTAHYNELRFEDKSGSEQVFLRAEKDLDTRVLNDSREWVGNDSSTIVKANRTEKVEGDESIQITGKRTEKVGGDDNIDVTGNVNQKAGQNISIQAGTNLYEKSGVNFAHEAGAGIHLKAGATLILEAGAQISLKVGGNFIDINPGMVSIQGTMVMINSGGSAGSGSGSSPTSPQAPKDPDEADDGSKGTKMN